MQREALIADASQVIRNARHNLRWIRKNPEKVDPSKRDAVEEYLQHMVKLGQLEKKNNRRAGRLSLRNLLRNLLSIISQNKHSVKPHT